MTTTAHRPKRLAFAYIAFLIFALSAEAGDTALKVYLLLGQSNMVGAGHTWNTSATGPDGWNVPTLEFLTENQAYLDSLPAEVYTFKQSFDEAWLNTAREDVWAVHYDSGNGQNNEVRVYEDTSKGDNSDPVQPRGIQPLSVGFGFLQKIGRDKNGTSLRPSTFGVELGLGHKLGDAMRGPVLLFKSSRGGTTLGANWRPPSAVASRGGEIGANYSNSMRRFLELLDGLDEDIASGSLGKKYAGATGYEVAGLVWLQGFNETVGKGVQYIPEYDQNLIDLIKDIRSADQRIPDDLPIVVVESSDQNDDLNAERKAAVQAINNAEPGSAVFIETDGLKGVNYGGLNAAGKTFSDGAGFHFHSRAENFLEMGYRIGAAILNNGYTGSEELTE